MAAAGLRDLVLERGTHPVLSIVWKDCYKNANSLAGYTAQMMIRKHRESLDPPYITFSTLDGSIQLEPGGEVGRIVVMGDTTHLSFRIGAYDLEIFPPGAFSHQAIRLLQGEVVLDWDVTR